VKSIQAADQNRFLFSDRFAPITTEIGFVESSPESTAHCFVDWQRPILKKRRVSLRESRVQGTLEHLLLKLPPLTAIEARRYLFVSTHSQWVAFFDNEAQGSDSPTMMSVLSRLLRCRTLRIAYVPDTMAATDKTARGRFGAVIFELFSPEANNPRNSLRSIALVNDGGRWVFEILGEPLPFESQSVYQSKRLRDRFPVDLMLTYASALGLEPFDENFYEPVGILVEKVGPKVPNEKEFSLEQVRSRF